MKVNFLSRFAEKIQAELKIILDLSSILNRNFDSGGIAMIGTVITGEINNQLVRLVTGNTDRIRAIRDVRRLEDKEDVTGEADLRLRYCSRRNLVDDKPSTPVEAQMAHDINQSRVLTLEMLRLAALSGVDVGTESVHDLIVNYQFRFIVADNCKLISKLDDDDYIKLECVADVKTGRIDVINLSCPSEDIDLRLLQNERQWDIGFDYSAIFFDYFNEIMERVYPDSDFDMSSYKQQYEKLYADTKMPLITVHFGEERSVSGRYPTRQFHGGGGDDWVELCEVFTGWPQLEKVNSLTTIPYMVAVFAHDFPEETDFRITYDTEYKRICLIPGDPYEFDTMA